MKLSTHDIGFEALDSLAGFDALCLFIGEDERPLRGAAGLVDWRMCGGLSRVLSAEFFTGARGDWLLLPSNGRIAMPAIFACGAGKRAQVDADAIHALLGDAAARLRKARVSRVALEVPGGGAVDDAGRARALKEAFLARFSGEHVAALVEKPLARLLPQG